MAEYEPQTATLGSLVAICPVCESLMYRRVNPANLEQVRGNLEVAVSQAPAHIGESSRAFVNSDIRDGGAGHGKAQRR
jgi:hypothetical protein